MGGEVSRSKRIKLLLLIFIGMALSSLAISFLIQLLSPNMPTAEANPPQFLRIEVLNGCGKANLAQKITSKLRKQGFDVVKIGNAESFDIPTSIVIDRTDNMDNAKRVAKTLGIKEIILAKDNYAFLDVTVVIGRDYNRLFPDISVRDGWLKEY